MHATAGSPFVALKKVIATFTEIGMSLMCSKQAEETYLCQSLLQSIQVLSWETNVLQGYAGSAHNKTHDKLTVHLLRIPQNVRKLQ